MVVDKFEPAVNPSLSVKKTFELFHFCIVLLKCLTVWQISVQLPNAASQQTFDLLTVYAMKRVEQTVATHKVQSYSIGKVICM